MSSTIPQLTLFPLYPGGPMVRNTGGINGYSSFYTRATRFTPSYGVNVQPDAVPANTYYGINANQTLSSQDISQARSFNTNLGFNGAALGGLQSVSTPSVAPQTPNIYRDIVALYDISDLKFADLMAQPSFRIPGIGMGLKVTTDGMGGVDTIELNPGSRGLNPDVSAFAATYAAPNRAEITTGATFKAIPDAGLGASRPPSAPRPVGGVPVNPAAQLNLAGLNRNAGIFNLDRLGGINPSLEKPGAVGLDGFNPILARLEQLQAPDAGLALVGEEAAIDAAQARQVATSQAKLDVTASPQLRENVAQLVSAVSRQGESYAAAFNPKSMDGRIPMAPSLPQVEAGSAQTGTGFGRATEQFAMGTAVADAMSRQSSGGYLPFQMQAGTQGQAFGGSENPFAQTGTGGGNPFAQADGQAHQQNRQRRRPLRLSA